jgi:hypothetical protein
VSLTLLPLSKNRLTFQAVLADGFHQQSRSWFRASLGHMTIVLFSFGVLRVEAPVRREEGLAFQNSCYLYSNMTQYKISFPALIQHPVTGIYTTLSRLQSSICLVCQYLFFLLHDSSKWMLMYFL